MPKGKSAELKLFADGSPTAGKARLRIIHASSELGMPDAMLNGKTVAHMLEFGAATPYWTVAPGTYELEIQDPKTGDDVMDTSARRALGRHQLDRRRRRRRRREGARRCCSATSSRLPRRRRSPGSAD